MFQKLAATGKLIRVSELDMGLQDADGNAVKTIDVTEEQHHAMAAYYKFIVEKYLSLIPVAKQYGITAWGVTDSPETSFWRAGILITTVSTLMQVLQMVWLASDCSNSFITTR
jgi:GH35 family endo-1,4-beta-xylanase